MSFDPYSAQSTSYGMAPDLQFYNVPQSSSSGMSMHPAASTGIDSMQHLSGTNGGPNGGAGGYYGVIGPGPSGPNGNMQSGGVRGQMLPQSGFWSAFTASPVFEGEPPLLEGTSFYFACNGSILITGMRYLQNLASISSTLDPRRGLS